MSDETARWRSLPRDSRESDGEGAQGLRARIEALLDKLGPRDVAAFAKLVERDLSYGERPAREEPR